MSNILAGCFIALSTDAGWVQQSKRGRAAPAVAREKKAQIAGQQSTRTRGNKEGSKLQQQLDVMHSKLWHFKYTRPKALDKLTHDTSGELHSKLGGGGSVSLFG